jgi:hypothetical protein
MDEETVTAVSPQSIQSDIAAGLALIEKTTSSYSSMVKKHGSDWTKWPTTSNWYKGLKLLQTAHDQAGLAVYSALGVSSYNK